MVTLNVEPAWRLSVAGKRINRGVGIQIPTALNSQRSSGAGAGQSLADTNDRVAGDSAIIY